MAVDGDRESGEGLSGLQDSMKLLEAILRQPRSLGNDFGRQVMNKVALRDLKVRVCHQSWLCVLGTVEKGEDEMESPVTVEGDTVSELP
jgi:hypothetical protein